MEFLRAGFDLLCSDLDVVWLRDPRPYLVGAAGTALLPLADVVVSTDVTVSGRRGANGPLCNWARLSLIRSLALSRLAAAPRPVSS